MIDTVIGTSVPGESVFSSRNFEAQKRKQKMSSSAGLRNAISKVIRSYPSLNLRLNVNVIKNQVDIVLPGLRYDDIDHFGQPDIWRVFDMMNSVEAAAFYNHDSYLDHSSLLKQNYTTITKACIVEVKKDFYEVVTPKGPIEVSSRLTRIGKSSFNTSVELFCGGKMKPSVICKNVHTIINMHKQNVEEIPEWWKNRFEPEIEDEPDKVKKHEVMVTALPRPAQTFLNAFSIPLSETDIMHITRCASYLQYFIENVSIASHRRFYKNLQSSFHEFHIKRVQLLYLQPSLWGDSLISESWEDEKNPLTLHCQISREQDRVPVWYGCMDLYPEVFGLKSA